MKSPRALLLACTTAWLLAAGLSLAPEAAGAHEAPSGVAEARLVIGESRDWSTLSAAQRQVLAPLAQHWATMDDNSREKWVNVANRFDRLSPAAQHRVQHRMSQWARLPAEERGEARLRYQQFRQLSPAERQRKWAAYQALSPEERQELSRQARRKAKPVMLGANMVGPREARQVYNAKRTALAGESDTKTNLVPNVQAPTSPAPTSVTPTMVRAGAGATTSLVSQRPAPPLHQHTGMSKIAASKGFVDPVTLLPRKGAQSAAMVPVRGTEAASRSDKR